MLMFSSSGYKDLVRNIEATGEFVCNLATSPLAERMNFTSAPFPRGVDEFEAAGLEKASGLVVACPGWRRALRLWSAAPSRSGGFATSRASRWTVG